MSDTTFKIEKRLQSSLARAGVLKTPHGAIPTPAFVPVGTKATVKSLTPEQVRDLVGAEVVLANTYHLYLQPGSDIIREAGGLSRFMHWDSPTMTDSGGFQVFSLGLGMDSGLNKFVSKDELEIAQRQPEKSSVEKLVKIDEDGVTFKSYRDGSEHRFTPECSIEIQHDIGADIIFAFDECPSPTVTKEYQEKAMERTRRWAERCLTFHQEKGSKQALFGIVQGGSFRELREVSAKTIGSMDFPGFGIGGSYTKEEMADVVKWVNELLPEEKPRHLLGIGEPLDLFAGIEQGVDTFDCVTPTRIARNGTLYTRNGKINILNN